MLTGPSQENTRRKTGSKEIRKEPEMTTNARRAHLSDAQTQRDVQPEKRHASHAERPGISAMPLSRGPRGGVSVTFLEANFRRFFLTLWGPN